ncbi:MAG: hypothetical protein PUE95_07460 [Lachnospiraceae bacterium]|nr:hypothetical protein [Lachnospiraceae bacterium]
MNIGSQNSNQNQSAVLNMNTNQAVGVNTQARENQRENQREQTNGVKQGTITRNFHFEVQKEQIEQVLQKPRSKQYMMALQMIDFLSSDDEAIIERLTESMGEEFVEDLEEMTDEEIFEMITKAFHEEFAELETNLDDELLAVLSRCYVDGCDCHAIDQYGHILSHYKSSEKLPEDLERGRMVYRDHFEKCQCVEVYRTCCRVISSSGGVEVIKK